MVHEIYSHWMSQKKKKHKWKILKQKMNPPPFELQYTIKMGSSEKRLAEFKIFRPRF